jgi:sarcosine oxidase
MPHRFDCIVAGLGAAGSATLHYLATRGTRAVGFDAHTPPHNQGSSHGESRMIREAYFEDPCYVPLVRRAYDLWHQLAAESRTTIIQETGGIFAGPAAGELIPGMRIAGRRHDIALVELSSQECGNRFPWLRPDANMLTITEPRAGVLYPEACITAQLDAAQARGAVVHTHEPILQWSADKTQVQVETEHGTFTASRLVLATGAWMTAPLAAIGVTVTVARQPLFWFRALQPEVARALPAWAVEFETGRLLYGFPDRGRGLKRAIHEPGTPATPETIDRTVSDSEIGTIRRLTDQYLPGMMGELTETATCMYTNATDGHFIIDTHPEHPNVLLVSACSGHGFKFSSAVGEAAAQWMLDGAPQLDLAPFALRRFAR